MIVNPKSKVPALATNVVPFPRSRIVRRSSSDDPPAPCDIEEIKEVWESDPSYWPTAGNP